METQITIFSSDLFGQIRTAMDEKGNPLFSLRDITNALGLTTQSHLKDRLNPKGVRTMHPLTNGGRQQMDFINEPNLYRCIFQSRKKSAIQFQDWIFEEVLPSIRNNGGYMVGQSGLDRESFDKAVAERANCAIESVNKQLGYWKTVASQQHELIKDLQCQLKEIES